MTHNQPWWQTTTIYQIYPRSFADSNNDGIGDLRGIISKLDYIQDLGFETLWISPFFCSPQQDFGYDVSDYLDIAPKYGTLSDAEELIQAVHARGMRILFDLVLNHTSIEHPWFQESRSSRDNPKRDWYIWRDGRGRRPPNNWQAMVGGSGWHYDEATGQWYYASFLPFQPDLNWRTPEVKQAMFDVVRFWLEKGVDGFRLDIFHSIFKDEHFRDNPFSFHYVPKDGRSGFFQEWQYTLNRPEVYELAKELRTLLDRYCPERILVGEVFGGDENFKRFLGENLDGLNLFFLWDLLKTRVEARFFKEVVRHYERHYPAPYTPVYVFGNHDQKRIISKVGGDPRVAKLLALFQFTVRGVPVAYYGEEIGMADGDFPAKTSLDPVAQRYKWIPGFLVDWLGLYVNRDGCRTPMQWDGSPNAGFCGADVAPWLPVHENRKWANVQSQQRDDDSILNTYKKLLKLRREKDALRDGVLQLLDGPGIDKNLLIYQRESGDEAIVVVINFGKKSVTFKNPTDCDRVLLTVGTDQPRDLESIQLTPFSGIILGG